MNVKTPEGFSRCVFVIATRACLAALHTDANLAAKDQTATFGVCAFGAISTIVHLLAAGVG